MYNCALGSFNIQLISVGDGEPTYVSLWTDAPVNSPFAAEWFNGLRVGAKGIDELKDVSVYNGLIVLTMGEAVQLSSDAGEIVRRYMQLVSTASSGFSEWDVARFQNAADRPINVQAVLAAMAVPSTPDRWENNDEDDEV